MQITIIRGLPGSGKSTYAHKLASQWGAVVVEQDQFRVRNPKGSFIPQHITVEVYFETKTLN